MVRDFTEDFWNKVSLLSTNAFQIIFKTCLAFWVVVICGVLITEGVFLSSTYFVPGFISEGVGEDPIIEIHDSRYYQINRPWQESPNGEVSGFNNYSATIFSVRLLLYIVSLAVFFLVSAFVVGVYCMYMEDFEEDWTGFVFYRLFRESKGKGCLEVAMGPCISLIYKSIIERVRSPEEKKSERSGKEEEEEEEKKKKKKKEKKKTSRTYLNENDSADYELIDLTAYENMSLCRKMFSIRVDYFFCVIFCKLLFVSVCIISLVVSGIILSPIVAYGNFFLIGSLPLLILCLPCVCCCFCFFLNGFFWCCVTAFSAISEWSDGDNDSEDWANYLIGAPIVIGLLTLCCTPVCGTIGVVIGLVILLLFVCCYHAFFCLCCSSTFLVSRPLGRVFYKVFSECFSGFNHKWGKIAEKLDPTGDPTKIDEGKPADEKTVENQRKRRFRNMIEYPNDDHLEQELENPMYDDELKKEEKKVYKFFISARRVINKLLREKENDDEEEDREDEEERKKEEEEKKVNGEKEEEEEKDEEVEDDEYKLDEWIKKKSSSISSSRSNSVCSSPISSLKEAINFEEYRKSDSFITTTPTSPTVSDSGLELEEGGKDFDDDASSSGEETSGSDSEEEGSEEDDPTTAEVLQEEEIEIQEMVIEPEKVTRRTSELCFSVQEIFQREEEKQYRLKFLIFNTFNKVSAAEKCKEKEMKEVRKKAQLAEELIAVVKEMQAKDENKNKLREARGLVNSSYLEGVREDILERVRSLQQTMQSRNSNPMNPLREMIGDAAQDLEDEMDRTWMLDFNRGYSFCQDILRRPREKDPDDPIPKADFERATDCFPNFIKSAFGICCCLLINHLRKKGKKEKKRRLEIFNKKKKKDEDVKRDQKLMKEASENMRLMLPPPPKRDLPELPFGGTSMIKKKEELEEKKKKEVEEKVEEKNSKDSPLLSKIKKLEAENNKLKEALKKQNEERLRRKGEEEDDSED